MRNSPGTFFNVSWKSPENLLSWICRQPVDQQIHILVAVMQLRDPTFQQDNLLRIYVKVRWRVGVKQERGRRKWRFTLLSLAIPPETLHTMPLLYCKMYSPFPQWFFINTEQITLSDLEWPCSVKVCLSIGMSWVACSGFRAYCQEICRATYILENNSYKIKRYFTFISTLY